MYLRDYGITEKLLRSLRVLMSMFRGQEIIPLYLPGCPSGYGSGQNSSKVRAQALLGALSYHKGAKYLLILVRPGETAGCPARCKRASGRERAYKHESSQGCFFHNCVGHTSLYSVNGAPGPCKGAAMAEPQQKSSGGSNTDRDNRKC